jgi:hypothetical protein
MPFVSSSGKVFHVDGPSGRRKLEQKAKPLLLGSAVLLCFGAVLRQGTAAASSTLMSPAAIKASRQLQGSAAAPALDQPRAEVPRAEVTAAHLNAMVEDEEPPGVANASSLAGRNSSVDHTVAQVAAALVANGSEAEAADGRRGAIAARV